MSLKDFRLAEKHAAQQQQVIVDLNSLVKDIERCEKTIVDLKTELEAVNGKHQGRRTTREDIDYLSDLLKCAKKKLTWEKHLTSLQKRTPEILARITTLMNDPKTPPTAESRDAMVRALEALQSAMERLQNAKVT
jgi:hypothetical protein